MGARTKATINTFSKLHLILWNADTYAESLHKIFNDEQVITSPEELQSLNFDENNFIGAVVLAELNWNKHSFSQLHGIEVANSVLRVQEKLKLPILFVSFFSLEQILLDEEGNKRLENQIVGAVGHDFLRLPVVPQNLLNNLGKLTPLNELQFADVFNNLCNLKGLINGRIHERQGQLRSLENQPEKLKEQARNIFEKSLNEISGLLKGVNGLEEIIKNLKYDFSNVISDENVSYETIQNSLKQSDNEILALISEERNTGEEKIPSNLLPKQPWKVLLLDDEPDSLQILQKTLERRGIEYFLAETVQEAEKIITNDIYNEITVAISDYRLLEKIGGAERHQRRQGYDFLFWLAEQDRFAHLVALSGLSRKFLLESFQKYNTRVDVYSKQDLTGERAVNLFVDNLIDRGKEVYQAVCSRPTVGDWKSLRPFYIAHRASTEYKLKELEINNRAISYIRQYEEFLHGGIEAQLLQPDSENLGKPTTKLSNKLPSDAASMEAFYDKLVCRRVALYLYLELEFSRDQVFAALKGHRSPAGILREKENDLRNDEDVYDEKIDEKLKAEAHKQYKESSKNLVTTNLALPNKIAGSDLLVEEKYWLETEIGIGDFDYEYSVAKQLPYFVQIGIERFLDVVPQVAERLRERDKRFFTRSGRVVVIGFAEGKEILKIIAQAVADGSERERFQHFLKSLDKNIRANVGDSPNRREILNLIGKISEQSK